MLVALQRRLIRIAFPSCQGVLPTTNSADSPFASPSMLVSDSHAHVRARAAAAARATPASCCGECLGEGEENLMERQAQQGGGRSCGSGGGEGGRAPSLSRLVICGTHPTLDWEAVAALSANGADAAEVSKQGIIVGFGVHPWYVPELPEHWYPAKDGDGGDIGDDTSSAKKNRHDSGSGEHAVDFHSFTADELLARLEAALQQHPRAIVGEIGLDKLRGPSQAAQEHLFLAQIRLAARYGRPVSLHCVRHYGLLLELLDKRLVYKEEVPPAIIVHGFSGSAGVAHSLLKLKHKKLSLPADGGTEQQHGTPPAAAAKRRGCVPDTKDVVKISQRVYFGIGASTSLTVKDCAGTTLPLLLKAERALAETDHFYDADFLSSSSSASPSSAWSTRRAACVQDDAVTRQENRGAEDARTAEALLAPVLEAAAAATGNERDSSGEGEAFMSEGRLAAAAAAMERAFDTAFASVLRS